MRREASSVSKQKPTEISFSQSSISSASRISDPRASRMSITSNKSLTQINKNIFNSNNNVVTSTHQNNNNFYNPNIKKPLLPPKNPSKKSPYFSSLTKQQIHCVICKKSYSTSDLQAHLLLHKQPKPTIAPISIASTSQPKPINKLETSTILSQSINKFKQQTQKTNSFRIPPNFSIASMVPLSQKISPPIPSAIFQPTHLSVDNESVSYEQLYLNLSKDPLKAKSPSKMNTLKRTKSDNMSSLFGRLNIKSCNSRYVKILNPQIEYDNQLEKWKDHRKTESGSSSKDELNFKNQFSYLY